MYPHRALVEKKSGTVTLQVVINKNGESGEVKIVTGIDPLCDQEAKRLVSLFKAWKPAVKNGETVCQSVPVSVEFTLPQNEDFHFKDYILTYLDDKLQFTRDTVNASYRWVKPVDGLGTYNADQYLLNLKNREVDIFTYRKTLFKRIKGTTINGTTQLVLARDVDSASEYKISFKPDSKKWVNASCESSTFTIDGKLISTEWPNGGPRIEYYSNGLVSSVTNYNKGTATTYSWYDNGQFESIIQNKQSYQSRILIEYWKKTGKKTIANGAGLLEEVLSNSLIIGSYDSGKKQGEFKEYQLDNKELLFVENFSKGELIDGFNVKKNIKYTAAVTFPEFQGGMNNMSKFLLSNLTYPNWARTNNIQGKVLVTFIVSKEGNIEEAEVKKGIGFGCDEEAIRVVKLMNGKWNPGIIRGEPARVQFSLPINFSLSKTANNSPLLSFPESSRF
ncbi:TonB family protein [Solitalea lacus]|uniref:TonB family protein n=1 Tax=Solitalea lacus TaxID=2911172 RepID=UPI003B846041